MVDGAEIQSASWPMPASTAACPSGVSCANQSDCGMFSMPSGIASTSCTIWAMTGGSTKTKNATATRANPQNTMAMPAPRLTLWRSSMRTMGSSPRARNIASTM